jgi:zinc transporter 1/2/3
VVAISFHGIFEGMAIGLQGTSGDVWYLFMAVSLHECTILFCIGVELISSNTKVFRMVLYILIVSLVSPVGIVIGIIISEKSFHGEVIHQALIIGCFQVSK